MQRQWKRRRRDEQPHPDRAVEIVEEVRAGPGCADANAGCRAHSHAEGEPHAQSATSRPPFARCPGRPPRPAGHVPVPGTGTWRFGTGGARGAGASGAGRACRRARWRTARRARRRRTRRPTALCPRRPGRGAAVRADPEAPDRPGAVVAVEVAARAAAHRRAAVHVAAGDRAAVGVRVDEHRPHSSAPTFA